MSLISIVTCSYNPDPRLLLRVLAAVKNLQKPEGYELEYILVDNNSSPALNTIEPYASWFEQNAHWARMVSEPKPGAAHGRIAAFDASSGELLVNFDDDNEPQPDYLVQLLALRKNYPEVGVWGPGDVTVAFVGEPEPWARKHGLEKFQELHLKEPVYSKDVLHFNRIPFGTGLVMERRIMATYKEVYLSGEHVALGRTGKSLVSSEDIQMVYMATRHNRAVGRAPSLKLRHLINEHKSNYNYLKRLYYGCSISGFPVMAQSFPEIELEKAKPLSDTLTFAFYNTYYLFKMGLLEQNMKKWTCQTAAMIATVESKYGYYEKPLPLYLRFLKKHLKI